jgi:hypothetical protein
MLKRMVLVAVVLGLVGSFAVSVAACRWVELYCDSDYLSRTNVWVYTSQLIGGTTYRFVLQVPYFSDFDMVLYHDNVAVRLWVGGGIGDTEDGNFTPTHSGTYKLHVYSYSGTGMYSYCKYFLLCY